MPSQHALLTAQLTQLETATRQTIETLFDQAAQGQPAGAMLVLKRNAGQVGICCLGGLRRQEKGPLLVCFRSSRQGAATSAVAIDALLNIVGQLESRSYTFEIAK